jgi:hypothetical protein
VYPELVNTERATGAKSWVTVGVGDGLGGTGVGVTVGVTLAVAVAGGSEVAVD